VNVKPSIKKILKNKQTINLPILKDVPIVFPCSKSGGFTFKVESGDGVLLVFSERSLEAWKNGNTDSAPLSNRKFDLTDAFAIPCIFPAKLRTPNLKNLKPGKGTMVTGSKLFLGDATQPPTGSMKPVNVDVVAMLSEVLGILDLLLTSGGVVAPPGVAGGPCTYPTLTTRLPDVKAYQTALSQLVLKP
jgi:hypothetical protein